MHECKLKISPIWCVLTDGYGNAYCMSCHQILKEEDIHPIVLRIIKEKNERR